MPVKEFEGAKWIPVSEHEESLAAVTRVKLELEGKATGLERDLAAARTKGATADGAAAEITELRTKLAASDARYARHVAIGALGITDPDIIDTIELKYESANKRLAAKDQRSFEDTLAAWAEDPTKAPSSIRQHFEGETETPPAGTPPAGPETPAGTPPAGPETPPAGGPPGRKLPPRPKPTPTKPGPQGKPITLEDIYGAKTEKELDALSAQFQGRATE